MSAQTIPNASKANSENDIVRPSRWKPLASGGGAVVGVAIAAAITSYTADKAVGVAAWVAVAVVGASTMISTARNTK